MIQCKDCEYCRTEIDGRRTFLCDPYVNIKETECLAKWQLIRLEMLLDAYRGMVTWYEKLSPLQDKIFKYMKREIEDIDESEQWRIEEDENTNEEEEGENI